MENGKVTAAAWMAADEMVLEFMLRCLQAATGQIETPERRSLCLQTLRSAAQQFRGEHLTLHPSVRDHGTDQASANAAYRQRIAKLCERIEQALADA